MVPVGMRIPLETPPDPDPELDAGPELPEAPICKGNCPPLMAIPPPESTVNGPFFPPDEVLHGNLSIFPVDCPPPPVCAAFRPDPDAEPEPEADADAAAAADARDVPVPALLLPPAVAVDPGAGLGKIGRSFDPVVVLVELVDCGEDLDEVVERGEGPVTGGEGVLV